MTNVKGMIKGMARVEWAHLCDYAFFDQSQKICMIGLFRMINVTKVPAQHAKCDFVFHVIGGSNETVAMQFQIIKPGDKDPLVNFVNQRLNLTPAGEVTSIVALNNLPLPDYGPYEIKISLDGSLKHTAVFVVNLLPKRGVM